MKIKYGLLALLGGALGLISVPALAVPLLLDDTVRCGAGNATNGIAVGDVTGNVGGANECWGTFDGNDPGPSGDGFQIGSMVFDFVAKEDTPGGLEGVDIGLDVSPEGGAPSGTWSIDPSKFDPDAFLIVLKASSTPGFAVWLFDGTAANSTNGTWRVAWSANANPQNTNPADLSHLSIYAKLDGIPPQQIPEPGILALLGTGLLGATLVGRRRRKRT